MSVRCNIDMKMRTYILGSNSTAITFFAFSNILTVRFPVPGPTSRTTSVGLRFAFATMASATPGFFRMCWPTLVLNLKTLLVVACALEYGDEVEAALLRLFGLSLPIVAVVMVGLRRGCECELF